jgi:ribosomal protein S27AE
MLHTKACPRCSGDLALVRDIDDTYLSCVQCGFVSYQLNGARPLAPVPVTR